jgi:glycosyltransferase involved in cell wall biosynthesis
LVSLVIPAKNESDDIGATLDACLAMRYEPKEILVVDDSTDDTPQIVAQYAPRGVRLIHREVNSNACCGARNLGMRSAKGEIVVLMNGDVRPLPDFIDRILEHYRNGADFLIVDSRVMNPENPWARFVHAEHLAGRSAAVDWSEGFSCRRAAAEAVGYIPGDYPIGFCRDFSFGRALLDAGFNKHYDPTIPMDHVAPRTLREFWGQRVWRGSFSPLQRFYMRGHSVPGVVVIEFLRACRTVAVNVLVVPLLVGAWRLSRAVPPASASFPAFVRACLVRDAGAVVGAWRGLRKLLRAEGWRSRYTGAGASAASAR